MRDCSLGAVLRACLRTLLHLFALFGSCVCGTSSSAHSITELPAPTSLSPFPAIYVLGHRRRADGLPIRIFTKDVCFVYFPRSQPGFGVPSPRSVPQCGHGWKDRRDE